MDQLKSLQQQQEEIQQQFKQQASVSPVQDGSMQQISLRLQEQEEQIFSMQNVILYRNQLLNDQFMKQSHRESQVNNHYNALLAKYDALKTQTSGAEKQLLESQTHV